MKNIFIIVVMVSFSISNVMSFDLGGLMNTLTKTKLKEEKKVSKESKRAEMEYREAIESFMAYGVKTEEKAKEWIDYGVSLGAKVRNTTRKTNIVMWSQYKVYDVSEAKEWKKNRFPERIIRDAVEAGYSASEANRYVKLGVKMNHLSNGYESYSERRGKEIKAENIEKAMLKVKSNKISELSKEECELLSAQMVMKDEKVQCNYQNLKWKDMQALSVGLRKEWRKNGYTAWETRQWNNAGIFQVPQEGTWSSPQVAHKVLNLGLKAEHAYCGTLGLRDDLSTCTGYESWKKTGFSDIEIKGWVALGLTKPSQANKLKKFGITIKTAPRYVSAGVTLNNLDDFRGMSLEDIEDEQAESDAIYVKEKAKTEAAEKKEKAKIEARKGKTKVLKFGQDYKCEPYDSYMGISNPIMLSVGRSSMIATSLMSGTSIELNFIESYDKYNLYTGFDNKLNTIKAKVLTKKGINGGNVNFQGFGDNYYCIKK